MNDYNEKLKKILANGNLAEYDFKNEIEDDIILLKAKENKTHKDEEKLYVAEQVISAENPLEKMLYAKYYAIGLDVDFDCDCCELMNLVYEKMWLCSLLPNKKAPRYSQGNLKSYMSDLENDSVIARELERETMNSFWSTLKFTWQICNNKELSTRGYPTKSVLKADIMQKERYTEFTKEITENGEIYSELFRFAILSHSIGNFTMLVNPNKEKFPYGFNPGRAIITNDYWDLSLKLMKNELNNNELFKAYINTFDLNDYIKEVDNDYEIVDLFESDLEKGDDGIKILICDNARLPDRDQLIRFLKNVNKQILDRGIRMVEKLG